jgi:large subunit ribosomal protein L30
MDRCIMAKIKKIKITQRRSVINRPKNQKLTILALGLGRINKSVEVEATLQIKGMVQKVKHLVTVTEL